MIKSTVLAFGLLLAVAPTRAAADDAPPPSPPSETWDARLVSVSGDVTLYEASGADDGVPAVKDMPLQEGDRLRTAADSSADIAFDGGGLVRLGPLTEFKVSNLNRAQTLFELKLGTFLAKFKKLLSTQTLQVRTQTAVASVRGTEFGLETSADGNQSHVGVFDEGKVEVKGSAGAESLIANQETSVGADGKPAAPYQLQRLARHRSVVRAFKGRLAKIARAWRPMTAARRAGARAALIARARERRERRERQRQREAGQQRRQNDRAKQERQKMERFRERIQRERGGRK